MAHYSFDIAVVGGGAAGLAAAITAARCGMQVAVLERNARVGKKLITTGNGRCNISNSGELNSRYHGDTEFAKSVFAEVTREDTFAFFESLGLPLTELEDGKLFPMSLQAGSVVDALRFGADRAGVCTFTNTMALSITPNPDGFGISCKSGDTFSVAKIIVTAGGMAAKSTGSDGNGYTLMKSLGHSVTPLAPAIVQLTCDTACVKPLKGIKLDARVTAGVKGESISQYGEVLFTEYGLSGPPILQIGRYAKRFDGNTVHLDLCPNVSCETLREILSAKIYNTPEQPITAVFMGVLPTRLGETIVRRTLHKKVGATVGELKAQDIARLSSAVKDFAVTVTGSMSFDNAQVTAGGVPTAEFDSDTMQSKICPGLYAAGEILDVDGDCGGFNLQWAWSSGILAGMSAAE